MITKNEFFRKDIGSLIIIVLIVFFITVPFINKAFHIDDIYKAVKSTFPEFCDDSFSCSENCTAGNDQPEWKHTVRNSMQSLKSQRGNIQFTGKRGYWRFDA